MSITVVRPGLLTTIQDHGRLGYQKYGVLQSGSMDTGAARAANLLVGNEEHEALLEVTFDGAEWLIGEDMLLSVCGAAMTITVDGEPLPLWRPVLVRAGAAFKFEACLSGCRAYVAVAGGLDVPIVMGSRSTYLRGAVGGYEGRALKSGDVLSARPPQLLSKRILSLLQGQRDKRFSAPLWHAGHFAIASNMVDSIVRVMPGSHFGLLEIESRKAFFHQTYSISMQSDRMGCRLEGTEKLILIPHNELLSEPVAHGTVQLPANGNPIVLLADRQTTGGYPRIAQVAAVDIPIFAQLKPGDRFRFEAITHKDAEQLYMNSEQDIQMLKTAIALRVNEEAGKLGRFGKKE
ncbi:biotin-dependent carboxyltransferase family protein [Paenibacillus sinopodophylli]|uniref:5-oxoprolinase subunit C family protein n=1 Tax=Paenibacillus sinopodophylli TaxID=1837342 RepID=UPI00110CD07B|nr:biotin-dependent carboxyltransferase family protein [Paenibacillus sinopodophylli]